MSRSRRVPYIKDRPRNYKKTSAYWRRIRHSWKNTIKRSDLDDTLSLPNAKSIVNDYDYCDYQYLSKEEKNSRK